MEITEVRIKLMEDGSDRLQAFCSITFDNSFVVRDLKIIEGEKGPFVAMPSRKLTARCLHCGSKNHLRAGYCNQCGGRLKEDRVVKDDAGRAKLYADIAHPINSRCREMIQERIILAFREEVEKSKLPGYVSSYDEFDFDEDFELPEERAHRSPHGSQTRGVSAPPVETTEVQPAERGPRGPHRLAEPVEGRGARHPAQRTETPAASTGAAPPAAPPSAAPATPPVPPQNEFGQGIL